MGKYKLHKKVTIRKRNPLIPQGVSAEEMALCNAIHLDFPKLQIYRSDRNVLHGREIDIWIPSKKLGVEFNGNRYHSSAMNKTEGYHLSKSIMAEKQGIKLLHIFSDMWENKKSLVIDLIRKLLGRYREFDIKDCSIQKISKKEGEFFFNTYRIDGVDYRATKFLGIFYNGYNVAALQYSAKGIYGYSEIFGIKIKGGLEELLKNSELEKLNVYTDRCLLEYLVWEDIGYKPVDCTKPRLFYTKDFKTRILNESTDLDEKQKKKMYTIYDCGELILKRFEEKAST